MAGAWHSGVAHGAACRLAARLPSCKMCRRSLLEAQKMRAFEHVTDDSEVPGGVALWHVSC